MKTRRRRLSPHAMIGLPALVLATSCVPADRSVAVSHRAAVADPRVLLSRMALHVPDDIAARIAAAPAGAAVPLAPSAFAAPPFRAAASMDDAARAGDCLTAAVYYEARSQSLDGQRAVAQVVLNRVRDRAFPASVCGVVYQGAERRTGCQFSFTCDGSMARTREPAAWDRARAVAAAALAGEVYAPVGAATSFHTTSILPWWASSLAKITTVGEHVFYRWQNALERALTFRQAYAGVEPGVPFGRYASARASAVTEAVPSVAGVTVHYGNRDVAAVDAKVDSGVTAPDGVNHGVTVHRGQARRGVAPMRLVSGVRLHVGVRTGVAEGGDGDGAGAIVSDET